MTTDIEDPPLMRPDVFIGGRWAPPTVRDPYQVIEAATEDPLGAVSLGGPQDIDRAVTSARDALSRGPWADAPREDRAAVMLQMADYLEAHAEGTSQLVSRENGMPITRSRAYNGTAPTTILRMYADLLRDFPFEDVRRTARGATLVRREPVGVVGAITPWNYPQTLAIMKIAPALAAGCTIVLKPSPETALDSYILADAAAAAGLPAGALNIVAGGRDVGAALVSHPGVDKIAFTGSTAAGRVIGAECGGLIRRMTLELGGKSAAIFLEDGNIDTFRSALGVCAFSNNSQTCTTQSRVLAPRSRYDEVVDAVATYADELILGDPLDASVTCGPMVSEVHRARVLEHISAARTSARLVTGNGATGMPKGWFVKPTVFADVDNRSRLAQEEVFGPVIAVIPYTDENEAVALANDSQYGLAGSVWTEDEVRGVEIAGRIRTGTIGINYYQIDLQSPAGGMKASGIGRENGPEGMDTYLEYKSIYVTDKYLSARSGR